MACTNEPNTIQVLDNDLSCEIKSRRKQTLTTIRIKRSSRILRYVASTAAIIASTGCGERSAMQSGRSSSNVVSSGAESLSGDSIAKAKVQNNCVALNQEICLGTVVDTGGCSDAAPGINSCLNALNALKPENRTLALPPGRYLIKSTIKIQHDDITLSTQGLSNDLTTCLKNTTSKRCAVLLAADDFGEPVKPDNSFARAMLRIGTNTKPVNRVTLDHIALDGAKDTRSKNGDITKNCGAGGGGRNLMEAGGSDNKLLYSASVNALCGTAVGWAVAKTGIKSEIKNNYIANNGIGYPDNTIWSDGLTIGTVSNATITGNLFQDSTDVDVVIGGATDTTFSNNIIYHPNLNSFAGFMLTNWSLRKKADPNCLQSKDPSCPPPPQWADFRGLVVSDNTFRCNYHVQICVQIGIFPWFYPDTGWANWRTMGGTFRNNEIYTQNQGINVGGGGTLKDPVILDGNKIYKTGAATAEIGAGSNRKSRPVGKLNVFGPKAENFIQFECSGCSPSDTLPKDRDVDQADPWHSIF